MANAPPSPIGRSGGSARRAVRADPHRDSAGRGPGVVVSVEAFDVDDPFGVERLPAPPVAPGRPTSRSTSGGSPRHTGLMTACPRDARYPIAANAAPDLLRHVGTLGARFVARSLADVRTLARLGVRAADLRLDTTVLPWWHVRDLHALGVWRFRVDSVRRARQDRPVRPRSRDRRARGARRGRAAAWTRTRRTPLLVEAAHTAAAVGRVVRDRRPTTTAGSHPSPPAPS